MAKTALVISGGGSKGAFAVGALSYIHQHVRPVDQFDLYCGTSTGSLITPLAAIGEMALLEKIYTTTRQADVLNMGGIGNLITAVSLHDATPLKNLIEANLTDVRFARLMASGKPVLLATICIQTEHLVYFTTQPAAANTAYDVERIRTATDLRRAMLASSCQPVFMQPIEWRPGAVPVRQYVDGGIRELTPFQAAIDNGAQTIIAITNSPDQIPATTALVSKALPMLERTIDLFSEDVSDNDYRLANLTRQTNTYLDGVKAQLRAQGVAPALVEGAFAQAGNPVAGSPITTIHAIRPQTKLTEGGPGGLTFEPTLMKQMFQKGFQRAKAVFEALSQPLIPA
ncbi:MAG: patatin-like phospholipase family protein [Bacteroidetes bacterium]|nr:patatin-like phospholipase family protein [Fibrella sp.]